MLKKKTLFLLRLENTSLIMRFVVYNDLFLYPENCENRSCKIILKSHVPYMYREAYEY